jgi:sugar phosphate isomerase/epimerase
MNGLDLVELAARHGLSGVEFPISLLPDSTEAGLDRFGDLLRAKGMSFVPDLPVIDVAQAQRELPLARRAGARIARCMASGFLEGARSAHVPDWPTHLREVSSRLQALAPLLERLDMRLAVENHQDVTADDMLALCQAGGPRVGVTLDVVNPLAVAEEPFEFARKLGPHILNVHIKDYTIHPTPSGYKLVRASIGEGTIDWRAMLTLIRDVAPRAYWHIELAALNARHIRLLEDQWWRGYPPRDVRDTLSLLRFVAEHALPNNAPWQTPWELEASAGDLEDYERGQFDRSIAYLTTELEDIIKR